MVVEVPNGNDLRRRGIKEETITTGCHSEQKEMLLMLLIVK